EGEVERAAQPATADQSAKDADAADVQLPAATANAGEARRLQEYTAGWAEMLAPKAEQALKILEAMPPPEAEDAPSGPAAASPTPNAKPPDANSTLPADSSAAAGGKSPPAQAPPPAADAAGAEDAGTPATPSPPTVALKKAVELGP